MGAEPPNRCRHIPSCCIGWPSMGAPLRGVRSPQDGIHDVVLIARVPAGPNPSRRSPPLQGVLIRCQSYHGDYACPFGDVAVPGSDGMGSSTQVPVVKCAWVPATTSHRARHLMLPLPRALAPISPTLYRKPLGKVDGSLRASQARGKRWSGLIGGKILSTHDY
jgi:hypothetical protein